MSSLDVILRNLAIMRDPRGEKEAKEEIKQLFLELVDKDIEPFGSTEMQFIHNIFNEDREEIRNKIKEL